MSSTESWLLFVQTLNVVNSALLAHKHRSPYRQLLAAYNERSRNRNICVVIYDEDPDEPIDFVTIRLRGTQFVIVRHGRDERAPEWHLSKQYLRGVVADPRYFVEHPSALNWDWISVCCRQESCTADAS